MVEVKKEILDEVGIEMKHEVINVALVNLPTSYVEVAADGGAAQYRPQRVEGQGPGVRSKEMSGNERCEDHAENELRKNEEDKYDPPTSRGLAPSCAD